uniref:Uncharacterized protein n=1 Tax=Anguilla anguilla TaxID=7936 RepID=A0A0E9TFQ9_ANGAN
MSISAMHFEYCFLPFCTFRNKASGPHFMLWPAHSDHCTVCWDLSAGRHVD